METRWVVARVPARVFGCDKLLHPALAPARSCHDFCPHEKQSPAARISKVRKLAFQTAPPAFCGERCPDPHFSLQRAPIALSGHLFAPAAFLALTCADDRRSILLIMLRHACSRAWSPRGRRVVENERSARIGCLAMQAGCLAMQAGCLAMQAGSRV